jgi:hypothetical protein
MMFVPNEIKSAFRNLERNDIPLENLRHLKRIREWVAESETAMIDRAQREQGSSFQEIGEVLEQPRQAVHRSLSRTRGVGLTHPDFDGVSSATLRYWLGWWRAPDRDSRGTEEAGRDPSEEADKVLAELRAREEAGILRKPIDDA